MRESHLHLSLFHSALLFATPIVECSYWRLSNNTTALLVVRPLQSVVFLERCQHFIAILSFAFERIEVLA